MSATRKQVTVVINGEEYVSTAAKQAEAGITLFGKRIPFVLDATKLLEMGLNAVRAAFGAAKDFVLNSIAAYDAFSASQRKLEGTAKLSGIAIKDLQDVADTGRKAFGLAAGTSNEFAAEIGKLTSKAGDITKSKDAMGAFLDIGAARGLSAAETLKAVQQAVLGIDEGTDKLFSKNPSVLYQEYADKVGKSAAKLTDQEKAQALLDATMTGGERVRGAYLDYLNSAAGQQEQANNKMTEAQVAFGAAVQPIRTLVLQGLNRLLNVLGPTVKWLGETANLAGVTIVQSFNRMRETVGTVAQTLGRMTGNRDLEEWGRRTAESARQSFAEVEYTVWKASQKTKAATQETTTAVTTAHQTMGAAAKASSELSQKAADDYFDKASAKLGRPLAQAIGLTEGALRSLSESAREQLPADVAEKFQKHMQGLVTASESARDRILGIKDGTGTAATRTKDMAREVEVFARGTLDAADAFGVIDDKSRKSLDSAISIATAIGGIIKSGFSFAGVTGVIGGVAALVNTMMSGDNERRQLQRESNERLRDNNARLKELTKEVGLLTLDVSGGEVASIEAILEDIVPKLARGGDVFGGPNSFSSIIRGATSSLISQGLGWDSIVALAKRFGINILDKDGAIDFAQLPVLLQALRNTNTAAPGQSFDSQLEILQQGFGVNATGDVSQIGQIMNLAERFSPALRGVFRGNNIAGTRADLQRLFNDLAAGRLTEAQLGGLTGSQFLRVITDVIGRIDRLPSGASTGPSGPTGSSAPAPTGGASGAPVTGAGGSAPPAGPAGGEVPAETIQSVIKAMDARMLSVLSSHTPLIDRIAVATEASATSLRSIDSKMDTLIEVTAGNLDATDAKLEAMRRLAALERGERPELG
jgi:hypothetical protein